MWPSPEHTKLVEERLGGGYNNMPPNYEVITESHYYWLWNIKPAHSIYQFRQAKIAAFWRNVNLFVHPGDFSGIGFYVEYDGKATRSEVDAYKPVYFKWVVCEHEFQTTHTANCYWEGKCTKCGYVKAVDSSG